MTAVDTAPWTVSAESPYVGLNFYTQENAAFFFGRDAERTVLISNLRASRLTLLYAQSGTGKSSVLRAGVASRLTQLARRSLDQRGAARHIPVVFSSWRDDPTAELIAEIQQATMPFLRAGPPGTAHPRIDDTIEMPAITAGKTTPFLWLNTPVGTESPQPGDPFKTATVAARTNTLFPLGAASRGTAARPRLGEVLEAASEAANATLLVMLDQFEEYFLYRSKEARDGYFADELADCINRADLRANFLISIREDAYSGIGDLFKSRIDNVYGNYLHLENLTKECARQAIEKPVASFNEMHPHEVPVEIQPALVDVVLDQLRPDQFVLDQGGRGRVGSANGDQHHGDEIAAPYLQLVMKRIWEKELPNSRTLRLGTLNALGGAQTIVRTHVDHALSDLPEKDREAAVDIFHHLVTPSGTKIALAAADLAEYTGRSAGEAGDLLERLASSDTRILRPVPPPPGHDSGTRYEISHDLLAPAILDWGGRQRAVRLEREKETAELQAQTEKRRARMFRALALGSAVLLVIAIVAFVVAQGATNAAQAARHQAESGAMAASAEAMLGQSPARATGLALRALKMSPTIQAQTALRDALPQLQLKATLTPLPAQRSAVFSPGGTRILTAAADGTIGLWDPASGKRLAEFAGLGPLNGAAFSPDGTQVVTAENDGTARILDASSGKVVRVLAPRGGANGYAVSSAAFSPSGELIATTYANGIARIWDAHTGGQLLKLTAEYGHVLLDAAFSPDSKLVVTASASGNARIFDAGTGRQLHVLPGKYGLLSAAFSPDGRFVVTACGDGTTRIWNAATGRLAASLTPPSYRYYPYTVFSAAFSPDGRQVVTAGGDGVARIWDWQAGGGRLVHLLGVPGSDSLQMAAYSPDGRSVVTASAAGLVRVWNTATGRPTGFQEKASGVNPLRSAVFSPDGTLAATGSQFGTVTIWKAPAANSPASGWKRLNVISLPEGDAVNGMAFSRNGKLLATADQSGRAYVWYVPSGLDAAEFDMAEGQPLNSVAFDPADQNLVVTADDDGYARIFEISTGRQVGYRFGVPGWDMNAAAYSPDGSQIVTASGQGYARIWDAATHVEIGGRFGFGNSMSSASYSRSGKKILTTQDDGYTDVWDAAAVGITPTFKTDFQEPGTNIPHDAAFSPDGLVVVTAGSDGTAREWSSATQTPVLAFAGHTGAIRTVAFNSSGTELITASSDGTAKIWDAVPVEQRGLLPNGRAEPIITASFSPADPRIVATANGNGTVSVWNTGDQAHPMATLHVPGAASAEFSADGKLLAAAGAERVDIWQMGSTRPRLVRTLDTAACTNPQSTSAPGLDSAVFSADHTLVVTSDRNGAACIWNVSTGKRVREFTEPAGVSGGVGGGLGVGGSAMRWAVFSPDGGQVLTASDDGTARIWAVSTGRQRQVVSEPTGEAINDAWFSPDGKLIVTASNDGTARTWNVATGSLLQTFRTPDSNPVYNAAFSQNGKQIVTCSGSTADIWSTTGYHLTEFQYGNTLSDCEFNREGSEVVTAGGDGYTRIFSTELAGNRQQIRQIAAQRLRG